MLPLVTERRALDQKTLDQVREWTVTSFEDGNVILTSTAMRTTVSFHFDADQWEAFRRFVATEESE